MLGKQWAGAGVVYYIVIPLKSLISGQLQASGLVVLQTSMPRIFRIRTHFRRFRDGPAVYGLQLFPLIP